MKKPTITQYRLASWSRLRNEKIEKARRCFERASILDERGLYDRADRSRREGDEYRNEAFGMVAALYCLGFSETEVFEAENAIVDYLTGETEG